MRCVSGIAETVAKVHLMPLSDTFQNVTDGASAYPTANKISAKSERRSPTKLPLLGHS
jgi:hypothetical protein